MTFTPLTIVIVGLGPGSPDLRTLGAQRALDEADRVILRTRIHPGLEDLAANTAIADCDDLYQAAADFSQLYDAIANRVLALAAHGGTTVYAVPGHARFAEKSVALIEARAREQGIAVDVRDGVSFVDTVVNLLAADPVAGGLQIADAEQLGAVLDREPYAAGLLRIDPTRSLLVAQVYNKETATAVKLALTRLYPDDHPVTLVQHAGVECARDTKSLPLHELDREDVDHLTTLWVPPLAPLDAARSPETLARIVARLRAPGGCPWDREQTHASLREALLEEAYEAVDAIDSGDGAGLCEELGDLLLLVMMHAQIADEEGTFQIEDVCEAINRKLVRRHPHVFGDATAQTAAAVITTWEGVKAAERAAKGDAAPQRSRFERLPRAMPAMRKAVELIAPRATLGPAPTSDVGQPLLGAILALIEQGYDPESVLETSLRELAIAQETSDTATAAVATGTGEGRS